MKRLPIGISTFSEIRSKDYYYVDKTGFVRELVDNGKYFFLSRPRRFGKSLFLDTLKEAFEGNRELFRDLYLEDHWDWDTRYPVIKISFGGGVVKSRAELEMLAYQQFSESAEKFGLEISSKNTNGQFRELITKLTRKSKKRVIVLVDEYDKPILDNITDYDLAKEAREGLKNIYSVIKESDAEIRFCFITGVSKFSKVSIFSGLNNLQDISLERRYADICGYRHRDLENTFAERLADVDLDELRSWYNGYSWLGDLLYNPFDVLLYLGNREFRNYWFETGTPTFLIDLFKKRHYFIPQIEDIEVTESLIGSFDIDFIEPENLLFQAGYLTIRDRKRIGAMEVYRLGLPNMEVRASLSDHILNRYCPGPAERGKKAIRLYQILEEGEIRAIRDIFHSLFASIPHDWYRKNNIATYEGYYASVFYCFLAALGLDLIPEDTTNHGRIDLTVRLNGRIYIFEFKVIDIDKGPGNALEQIKSKGYAEKYQGQGEIWLIGIEFSKKTRNIESFRWERGG